MARTLTVGTALAMLNSKYPRVHLDGIGARYADEVIGYMWGRYPWKESLAELPPFHLTVDETDYGPPLLAVPADFYALHSARVMSSQGYISEPLGIHKDLRRDGGYGEPTAIAYQKATNSFRVHPTPTMGGAEWWVEGEYKTTYTKVTNANAAGYLLPWDDIYFDVFRAGLRWKLEDEIIGNPREAMRVFAQFVGGLDRMATTEGVNEGQTIIAPTSSLELG